MGNVQAFLAAQSEVSRSNRTEAIRIFDRLRIYNILARPDALHTEPCSATVGADSRSQAEKQRAGPLQARLFAAH